MINSLWNTENSKPNTDWLAQNGWIITLVISIILVIAFFFVVFLLIKVRRVEHKMSTLDNSNEYIDAFGGKENILSAEAKGSRLIVKLIDFTKMDQDKLKTLGLDSLIKSTDKITFIVGQQSEVIAKELTK